MPIFRNFLTRTPVMCMNAEGGDGGSGGGGEQQPVNNAQQPANQGANGTQGLAWLQNATQEEVAFAQSKGWDKEVNAPTDQIFRSYHNLQKLFGQDKAGNTVVLPGENADQATLDSFYNRLGRPEKVDGYSVKAFAGLNDEQYNSLREAAHRAGITDKQFTELAKWNEDLGNAIDEQLKNQVQMEEAEQKAKIKQEWGAAYDQNLQLAKEAVQKLGWTNDQVNAMQLALGFDGVLKLAHQIGKAIGEGTFISSDNGSRGTGSNVMTPEQAKQELKRLSTDKEFTDAWLNKDHPRHQEMINRKTQLTAWSTGQKG